MKFSSNYIARKNGVRYEIKYGAYLDGKEQENKFYFLISHPNRENVATERSLRFFTPESAMKFCEEMIASGKVTIADLRANEERAAQEIIANRNAEAEQKVAHFLAKMKELGVDPVAVPEILAAYREMDNTLSSRAVTIFNERIAEMKKQPAPEIPDDKVPGMTLGEHGIQPFSWHGEPEVIKGMVDTLNSKLGVSKAQAAAMRAGCLIGWQDPSANPQNYDVNGNPIKPKGPIR